MATATNLPAASVSGDVLTAAYVNGLRGAFRILQVISAGYSTATTNSTTTYAATGLSTSITPQSASSKILVILNVAGTGRSSGNGSNVIELRRGSTQLATQNAAYTNTTTINMVGSAAIIYLDSPSTTSATTYDARFKADAASCSVIVQDGSSYSSITLLEVSA